MAHQKRQISGICLILCFVLAFHLSHYTLILIVFTRILGLEFLVISICHTLPSITSSEVVMLFDFQPWPDPGFLTTIDIVGDGMPPECFVEETTMTSSSGNV